MKRIEEKKWIVLLRNVLCCCHFFFARHARFFLFFFHFCCFLSSLDVFLFLLWVEGMRWCWKKKKSSPAKRLLMMPLPSLLHMNINEIGCSFIKRMSKTIFIKMMHMAGGMMCKATFDFSPWTMTISTIIFLDMEITMINNKFKWNINFAYCLAGCFEFSGLFFALYLSHSLSLLIRNKHFPRSEIGYSTNKTNQCVLIRQLITKTLTMHKYLSTILMTFWCLCYAICSLSTQYHSALWSKVMEIEHLYARIVEIESFSASLCHKYSWNGWQSGANIVSSYAAERCEFRVIIFYGEIDGSAIFHSISFCNIACNL